MKWSILLLFYQSVSKNEMSMTINSTPPSVNTYHELPRLPSCCKTKWKDVRWWQFFLIKSKEKKWRERQWVVYSQQLEVVILSHTMEHLIYWQHLWIIGMLDHHRHHHMNLIGFPLEFLLSVSIAVSHVFNKWLQSNQIKMKPCTYFPVHFRIE